MTSKDFVYSDGDNAVRMPIPEGWCRTFGPVEVGDRLLMLKWNKKALEGQLHWSWSEPLPADHYAVGWSGVVVTCIIRELPDPREGEA